MVIMCIFKWLGHMRLSNKQCRSVSNNVTLWGWVLVGQINNAASPWLGSCRNYDPAYIVAVNEVKKILLMLDNPRDVI